jgi:hypothetical protein
VRDRGGSARRDDGRNRSDLPERSRLEDERLRQRAELQRQREKREKDSGHTFAEHVDASNADLRRRAATGVNARGQQEERPVDASRWRTDEACMRSAETLWRTPEARTRKAQAEADVRNGARTTEDVVVSARRPLPEVLGSDWRNEVIGYSRASGGQEQIRFTAQSQARAVWRMRPDGRWYLYTCYPGS